MNGGFIPAIGIGGNAKISTAVLSAGACETKDADKTIGRVLFLEGVTIVGKGWFYL